MNSSYLFDLSHYQLIAISGEKSATFLQGQVTCDIREINNNQTRRGAHCSPKGRMLSTFRVLQFNTQLYLVVPAVMSELVIQQLKKYAVFSKVTVARENSFKFIGCVGKEIAETLATIFGELPAQSDQAVMYQGQDSKNLMLICVQGALPRFEILGDTESIAWLRQGLLEKHLEKINDSWRLLDIDLGIATVYPDTRDLFTPQMLNYPALNAVSFKKGCYTGQEVIARTHYLGKVKRHLHTCILKSESLPQPGDALINQAQQIIGTVVDAIFAGPGECKMLAVLQDEALAESLYWQRLEFVVHSIGCQTNSP